MKAATKFLLGGIGTTVASIIASKVGYARQAAAMADPGNQSAADIQMSGPGSTLVRLGSAGYLLGVTMTTASAGALVAGKPGMVAGVVAGLPAAFVLDAAVNPAALP